MKPVTAGCARSFATRRHILTGAPGAGKTVLLRQLEANGFSVIEEAATDVIALEQAGGMPEPWTDPAFPDRIATLQARRLGAATHLPGAEQFHDRSVICTLALAAYLGQPASPFLAREAARAVDDGLFEPRVLLVELLGFITRTEARRIGYAEALRFAAVHEETYARFGFEFTRVAPGSPMERAAVIQNAIGPAHR